MQRDIDCFPTPASGSKVVHGPPGVVRGAVAPEDSGSNTHQARGSSCSCESRTKGRGPRCRQTAQAAHCFSGVSSHIVEACVVVFNKHAVVGSLLGGLGLHDNSGVVRAISNLWRSENLRPVFAIQEKLGFGLTTVAACVIRVSKRVFRFGCDACSRVFWLSVRATKERAFWDAIAFLFAVWLCLWVLDGYIINKQACGWVSDGFAATSVASYTAGFKAFEQDSKNPSPFWSLADHFVAPSSSPGGFAKFFNRQRDEETCIFNSPLTTSTIEWIQCIQSWAWCLGYIFGDAFNFFGWYTILDFITIVFDRESLASVTKSLRRDQGYQLLVDASPICHGIGIAKSKAGVSIQFLVLGVIWIVIASAWNGTLLLEDHPRLETKLLIRAQIVALVKTIISAGDLDVFGARTSQVSIGSICRRLFYYYCFLCRWLHDRILKNGKKANTTEPPSDFRGLLPPSPSNKNSGIDAKKESYWSSNRKTTLNKPYKTRSLSPPRIICVPTTVDTIHSTLGAGKNSDKRGDYTEKKEETSFSSDILKPNDSSEELGAEDASQAQATRRRNQSTLALSKHNKLTTLKLQKHYFTTAKKFNPSEALFTEGKSLADPSSDFSANVTQAKNQSEIKFNDILVGGDGLYLYPEEIMTEHSTAARALDNLIMRKGSDMERNRLCRSDPSWSSDMPDRPLEQIPKQVSNQILSQWRATDQSHPASCKDSTVSSEVVQDEQSSLSEASRHEARCNNALSLKRNAAAKNVKLNVPIPIDEKSKRFVKESSPKQKISDLDSLIPNEVVTELEIESLEDTVGTEPDTSLLLGMMYLKKKKARQLRTRKFLKPPPNFHRMKKLKQQKESVAQRKEESREEVEQKQDEEQDQHQRTANPPSGFGQVGKVYTPPKKSHRLQRLGIIINGKITETIPEEVEICLGSPSCKERVLEFQQLYREGRPDGENE